MIEIANRSIFTCAFFFTYFSLGFHFTSLFFVITMNSPAPSTCLCRKTFEHCWSRFMQMRCPLWRCLSGNGRNSVVYFRSRNDKILCQFYVMLMQHADRCTMLLVKWWSRWYISRVQLVPVVLGVLCEADINECKSDPCPSDSECFNFDGGYACNCSDPALCPSLYTNIVPSSWGASWEEIVAIIGQSVLLLICVII